MSTSTPFKFVCTGGPYGDCMSSYRVEMSQPCTIAQLIEFINGQDEWGTVYINPQNWLGHGALAKFEYNNHTQHKPLAMPPFFHNKRIKSIKAHGGWSAMDYNVTLEDEL
nr:MAG TPA: hypothetical protein [Caudoviricetes sp.]